MHDVLSGRAVTGVVHFYNKTLVNWYCKKQSTTESATYGFGFLACQTCFDKSSIIDNTFDILEYRYTRRTVHGETTMLWLIVLLFLIQSYINDITFCPFTLLEVWLHVDILIYSTLSQNAILPIFLLNIGVTKVHTCKLIHLIFHFGGSTAALYFDDTLEVLLWE